MSHIVTHHPDSHTSEEAWRHQHRLLFWERPVFVLVHQHSGPGSGRGRVIAGHAHIEGQQQTGSWTCLVDSSEVIRYVCSKSFFMS